MTLTLTRLNPRRPYLHLPNWSIWSETTGPQGRENRMGSFLLLPHSPKPASRSVLPVADALKLVPKNISQIEDAQVEKVPFPRQRSPPGHPQRAQDKPFPFLCCISFILLMVTHKAFISPVSDCSICRSPSPSHTLSVCRDLTMVMVLGLELPFPEVPAKLPELRALG